MSASTNTRADVNHRARLVPVVVGIIATVMLAVLGLGMVANASDQVAVSITNTFSPANLTINIGTTVTWTNNDGNQHELRSDSGPNEFRTDNLDPGQSAAVTFNTLGTYTYGDHRNDNSTAYRGTISVINGAIPATPPPATPTPGATPPPAAPTTASIHLAGAQFAPATVTVGVGATVTWTNDDGAKHTVTAADASFDSGSLSAGATFVHTFSAAGTFPYGCDFHGNMRGTIIVTAGGAVPPPAAAPPANGPGAAPPAAAPPANGPVAAPPVAPVAGATNASVTIVGNLFSPATISVTAGGTVSWANNDSVTHTVTADDQSFTSGLLKGATTWSRTFPTPGTFTYFCEIHPQMTGTVVATAPDGSAPAAAPSAAAPQAAAPASDPGAAAAAAGTAGTASSASTGAAQGSINITDSGFTPASFRLAVGGALTFANSGKAAHTVTATNGSFDSGMIKSGATWAHTFTTAGSFTYSCILHPAMKASIDVVAGASGAGGSGAGAGGPAAAAAPTPVDSTPTTTAATPVDPTIQPVNIDVVDNEFKPNPATVAVGGTVTWKLSGVAPHTVTATDQSFNSGLLKPGESYQNTFTTLGSFTYACLVHPAMKGTINVVPPEQAAAAQLTSPTGGDGQQAQQIASEPVVASATTPPKDGGMWGNTLLGIAAAVAACCLLVLALKSFLKVLSAADPDPETHALPTEGLTPNPI
jgi:plastocyanin